MTDGALRALPSVDRVLNSPRIKELADQYARDQVVEQIRVLLSELRSAVTRGEQVPALTEIEARVEERVARWVVGPIPVINATGVILHTNLGRAPLSRHALDAVMRAAEYSDLELDLGTGKRGSRQEYVAELVRAVTGAEAGYVTSNNASAVLLALTALTRGKEVIVSRGQAVEIGGGFRVPAILRQSGARLVEVGTTNRTRLDDYAGAITPRTAAILHVHPSNFKILGFTEAVPLTDLAGLAHERGLYLIADNGSGALLDTVQFGLAHEPMPAEALTAGADLVAFSGDKLVGGPQSGLLAGRADLVRQLAAHPLARAVRPGKMTVAALSATLLAYVRERAVEDLPVWQMIAERPEELERRATAMRQSAGARGADLELRPGESAVGGGSLPGETLPTTLLRLPRQVTARKLRALEPPIIARTREERVEIDLRTVPADTDSQVLDAILSVIDSGAR